MSKKQKSNPPKKVRYDLSQQHPREILAARLDELGKSRWWLLQRSQTSEAVFYRFMNGESDTSSEGVASMFAVVGLELRPTPGFKASAVPVVRDPRVRKRA